MPVIGTLAAVSARGFGFGTEDMFGEQVFTNPGTYTFYVPSGVTALSMVAIGGGAGGGKAGNYTSEALPLVFNNPPGSSPTTYRAGGGGGLAYSNAVSVTPGQPLTVVVGDGGFTFTVPQDGGDSYVQTAAAVKLVHAGGGKGAASGGVGGAPIVGSGGSGGTGGEWSYNSTDNVYRGGGGGGAGGYSGNGGNGGSANNDGSSGSGGGAGGGGGGGGVNYPTSGGTYLQYVFTGGGAGGGVGLYGQGSNGAGGTRTIGNGTSSYSPSLGGSAGSSGNAGGDSGTGQSGRFGGSNTNSGPGNGTCGGGAGNGGSSVRELQSSPFTLDEYRTSSNGSGGTGGVRIIWTTNQTITRAFPSTNVERL